MDIEKLIDSRVLLGGLRRERSAAERATVLERHTEGDVTRIPITRSSVRSIPIGRRIRAAAEGALGVEISDVSDLLDAMSTELYSSIYNLAVKRYPSDATIELVDVDHSVFQYNDRVAVSVKVLAVVTYVS